MFMNWQYSNMRKCLANVHEPKIFGNLSNCYCFNKPLVVQPRFLYGYMSNCWPHNRRLKPTWRSRGDRF